MPPAASASGAGPYPGPCVVDRSRGAPLVFDHEPWGMAFIQSANSARVLNWDIAAIPHGDGERQLAAKKQSLN
jgi:hypothetical protein